MEQRQHAVNALLKGGDVGLGLRGDRPSGEEGMARGGVQVGSRVNEYLMSLHKPDAKNK